MAVHLLEKAMILSFFYFPSLLRYPLIRPHYKPILIIKHNVSIAHSEARFDTKNIKDLKFDFMTTFY